MILRSVMRHVRDQNWVAVGLDFLIVVVGVFIGIQVANWNDWRLERIEEQTILERLQVEVEELIDAQRDELDGYGLIAANWLSAQPVLFGQAQPRTLSVEECMSIVSSHIFRRPSDELPVLDEVRDSGRFDLLRDPNIKSELRNYILLRERQRNRFDELSNEPFRLHSRHPEVIGIQRAPIRAGEESGWSNFSGAGFQWNPECDVLGMRESPGFLNEYVDNMSRNGSMVEMYEERIRTLLSLQQALADGAMTSSKGEPPE
ncbi:hypothetical protein [Wenzhouxiangella marina]|uniref:Uncharacterized protein n=1 Tax=Wenzhouxiangella marina TaxID=1579979 RepID=A0A0K0XU05_9GAMM|nr:hypothetical protein [Wenzhouxiangella marina]AKS41194.1 hypothetical protein WM2015_813 [Wenzhouxiangella marina]MBB6088073.1 hypothetical protein [Wenzhouxiangella marina]